jgi:transcriptional regulator with XRE-family HTH domain
MTWRSVPRRSGLRTAFHVDDPVAVGRRIRQRRQELGLSLRQIAGPGCSPGYLSRIERGQRVPSVSVMADLAGKLDVTVEDLGGRDIRMRIPDTRLLDLELAARMGDEGSADAVRRVLDEARGIGDRRAETRLLEVLAHLAAEARRDDEAVRLCEEAISVAPGPASSRARPALHETLGRAYAGSGEMRHSIEVLRSALDEALAEPADPSLAVRFGVLLASAYTDAGLPDEAFRTLDTISAGREVLTDSVAVARLEWALSRTYAEDGQTELAERYARRVVSALACGEHLLLLGRSHMLLGSILLDRSRHAEADAELARATEVLEHGGAPAPELALLDYERGRSALLDGRLDDADNLARSGLERTESTEPGTAGMLYTLLAKIALARGELEEGRRLCHDAAGVLAGTVAVHYLDDVWQTLADIEERAGNLPAALAALRRLTAARRPATLS